MVTHLKVVRNSCSVRPSLKRPMFILSLRLMAAGTVASMSSSMLPNPQAFTMSATSASEVLLWRRSNLPGAGNNFRLLLPAGMQPGYRSVIHLVQA